MADYGKIQRGVDNGTRIYVGRLSSRARERDVDHFFRGYGKLKDVVLKNGFGFVEFEDGRDADDAVHDLNGKDLCGERVVLEHSRNRPRSSPRGGGGAPRGGFSRYNDYGGGRGDNRRDFGGGGRGGGFKSSRYGPPQQTRHKVRVENLSSTVSWQDLKDIIRKVAEVTFADAHRDRKNEGVVCFASASDMKDAIDRFDGEEIRGRKIKMVEVGGGSRSRSRSRSRSPRSRSGSRSRSKSNRRSRSSSRSRSGSRDNKHDRSKSRSRSGSPVDDKKRRRSGSRSDDDVKSEKSPNLKEENGKNDKSDADMSDKDD